MIERIVVAMDGSMLSREAFENAAHLARAADLPLQVLHVREKLPIAATPVGRPDDEFMNISEALDACRTSAKFHGQAIDVVVEEGILTDWLEETTDAHTLTVVGLKGRFASVGIGSTTRWLLGQARGPVMILTGPTQRELNRVLAVADGTPQSQRAIDVARDLAKRTGWPLTIQAIGAAEPVEQVVDEAAEHAPEALILPEGADNASEAELIESAAQRYQHALPILGAYPDSWLHQFIRGGMTGHVLKHLWAPIVLVN